MFGKGLVGMVASAIFFLDLKGKVLLSRNYRGDIPMEAAERFLPLLTEIEEDQKTPTPVIYDSGLSYVYLRHNNLYRMALLNTIIHILTMFRSISDHTQELKCHVVDGLFEEGLRGLLRVLS